MNLMINNLIILLKIPQFNLSITLIFRKKENIKNKILNFKYL